ncbi:glycosyltransferase [Candidatus Uhrbacteria bacterium]|nr:glycosyltransferase [Candidatus Uhrbacteria bacterium]
MQVVHLSCVAPPQTGGIGQVAFEQVKRLRQKGVQAYILAPTLKTTPREAEEDFVVRRQAFIRWGNAAALSDIDRDLKKADVIHLHYPFFGTAEKVAQWCLWRKKPLVMTFHMDAQAPFPMGLVFDAYRILAQPAVLRACKKIFVSSADYADASSIAGFKHAHPDRLMELPFGVEDVFAPGAGDRSRFDLPEDVPVIGFVGGMDRAHAFKGVPVLLKAFASLRDEARLLLVGQGELERIFEARAKELKIAPACRFTGRLASREDLANAYRCMDLFAFPSTSGAEAFGLVAAEAERCGAPVVASNLPGVRTVVRDGETGTLVKPNDPAQLCIALQRLLADRPLRERYAHQAAVFAREQFNWDVHVERLMEEYRSFV